MSTLGAHFEREIFEQPDVWDRLAHGTKAERLAKSLGDDVVLVGSGSSLCVAELGAVALRRRCIRAQAVAATEARLDHCAYERKTVIAVSQSGASTDLLAALDVLKPRRLIALTNTGESALVARAHVVIDVEAGTEVAVPASKSVTACAAILLRAASILGASSSRSGEALVATARTVRAWLDNPTETAVADAADEIAARRNVAVLGSDYGLPVAREIALKLKEASYLHAEGFAAGEFRHGSVAMVDNSFAVIGIVDDDALPVVARPMREIQASGAMRCVIGSCDIDDVPHLGPLVEDAYNTLAWLVTAQMLTLYAARARGIDCDAPRGLTKALIGE